MSPSVIARPVPNCYGSRNGVVARRSLSKARDSSLPVGRQGFARSGLRKPMFMREYEIASSSCGGLAMTTTPWVVRLRRISWVVMDHAKTEMER